MIPAWVWAAGALFLLSKKQSGTPAPQAPKKGAPPPPAPKPQKRLPSRFGDLIQEIKIGLNSPAWSAASKDILKKAGSLVLLGHPTPEQETEAYDLLKSLDEGERFAFIQERGKTVGEACNFVEKLNGTAAKKGYAMAGWVYLHFGGLSQDGIKMGQEAMGLPVTGVLDAETIQAIRNYTGRDIWSKVRTQWGAGEEGLP